MDAEKNFRVVANGELLPGFEPEDVVSSLATLCNITSDRARRIVGHQTTLRSNVALNDAEFYRDNIQNIGLRVEVEAEHTVTEKPDKPTAPASPPTAGSQMICAACNHMQASRPQCSKCGIYVTVKQKPQAPSPAAASGDQAPKPAQAKSSSHASSDDAFDLQMLILPVVIAVLGALAWKFLAVQGDREYAIAAWAIGSGIGFGAATMGMQGTRGGIICSVLLVLSIFAGKYMAYNEIRNQPASYYSNADYGYDDAELAELHSLYDELKLDAAYFKETSRDAESVKTFMMNHNYVDYNYQSDITEDDISYFEESNVPELEWISANKPDFDKWLNYTIWGSEDSEMSSMQMVFDTLGPLDLIFLFLGIGSAFKLGSGREEQAEQPAQA